MSFYRDHTTLFGSHIFRNLLHRIAMYKSIVILINTTIGFSFIYLSASITLRYANSRLYASIFTIGCYHRRSAKHKNNYADGVWILLCLSPTSSIYAIEYCPFVPLPGIQSFVNTRPINCAYHVILQRDFMHVLQEFTYILVEFRYTRRYFSRDHSLFIERECNKYYRRRNVAAGRLREPDASEEQSYCTADVNWTTRKQRKYRTVVTRIAIDKYLPRIV